MNRRRESANLFLHPVVGPVVYIVIWLVILPVVSDASTRLAVMSLTLFTGLYCYVMADYKGLNAPLWAALGVVAGFFELGIVPVLLVGLLGSKHPKAGAREPAPGE